MDLNEIHVLVIDDEEFMRGMVLRFLEMMGISKVTEATDGADGLTKLMNIQLDLIVLDIRDAKAREVYFPISAGYTVANVSGVEVSDYYEIGRAHV